MIVIKWFLYFVSELCLLGAFICSLNLWQPKIQRANSVDESFRIPELNNKESLEGMLNSTVHASLTFIRRCCCLINQTATFESKNWIPVFTGMTLEG